MMSEPFKQSVLSVVRVILVAVGALITKHGLATESDVNEAIGIIVLAIPLVWGIYDKYSAERKTGEREGVALNAGIRIADATEGPTPAVAPASVKAVLAATAESNPPQQQSPAKE